MTQHPSPYEPPQGLAHGLPYGNSAQGFGSGSRASVLMYVLGGLAVLGGLCCGVTGATLPQILAQRPEVMGQMPAEATPEMLRIAMILGAGAGVLYGAGLVALGPFVARGRKGAIVTAIVLAGISVLYWGFTLLGVGRAGMAGACMAGVPLALHVLLLVWLVQALRAPAVAQQYSPEYLQYLQQQYAYQQWQQQQQQQGGQVPPPPPVPQQQQGGWAPPPVPRGEEGKQDGPRNAP